MRILFTIISLVLLSFPTAYCLAEEKTQNNAFNNLKKSTTKGFVVPFTIRYNPDEWACKSVDNNTTFNLRKNFDLSVTFGVNKSQKKMSVDHFSRSFEEALRRRYSDPSLYASLDFKPNETTEINGLQLLHQSAVINLVSNSVHIRDLGKLGRQKRYISAEGKQDQVDYYIYSGDTGTIYICVESEGVITQEDQAAIDEFLRGFSLDGSACKGPAAIRTLKTLFEAATGQ